MPTIKLISLLLTLLTALSLSAETIEEYKVQYAIDGQKVRILDSIQTNSNQEQITIGIAVVFQNPLSPERELKHQVISTKFNGQPIPYETETVGNRALMIGFGEEDKMLPKGPHHYALEAIAEDLIVAKKDDPNFSVLERSINGNYWALPIDKLSVQVILPEGTNQSLVKAFAYTKIDDKKDLTTGHSSVTLEKNRLVANFHCLKTIQPEEQFFIYLEYPNSSSAALPEGKTLTAESAETITVDGKKINVGKTVTLETEEETTASSELNPSDTLPSSGTIKIHGTEVKVGKSINLNDTPPANQDSQEVKPLETIKIEGKDIKVGKSFRLDATN